MCGRRDQVIRPISRFFACPFGRHTWRFWHVSGSDKVHPFCAYCPATRLPSEHDIDTARSSPFADPDLIIEFVEKEQDDND